VLVLAGFRTKAGERVGVAGPGGSAAARRKLLLVRASFATDRMIRRRSIRMICAGAVRVRRVLHNRGLTVVTVPADTDCTIRLENPGAGLTHGRPQRRGTDRPRLSPGPPLPLRWHARQRSPCITTRVRNRGALAPGLMRIG
jgi:hypothetical protein